MQRLKIRDFLQPDESCHYASLESNLPKPDPPHTHDFSEVFWIENGQGWHWINGERRPMGQGQLVLIRPTDVHAFSADAGDHFHMVNVAFPVGIWAYLQRRYFPGKQDIWRSRLFPEREHQLSTTALLDLQRAAAELATGARSRLAIERFLLNLCHTLEHAKRQAAGSAIPDWLAKACREISQERYFATGASAFVKLAGRSAEHVAREARRWLGKTPTQIVNQARMAYAALRLAQTRDKIIEITLDCGFNNPSHFHKIFRQQYGTTPQRFRLQQQWPVRTQQHQ